MNVIFAQKRIYSLKYVSALSNWQIDWFQVFKIAFYIYYFYSLKIAFISDLRISGINYFKKTKKKKPWKE